MDDKPICYRCRSEIYRHQGTAYYGYYIAHKSPDDCTAYLNRKIQELEARLADQEWRPNSGTLGDLYDWIDRAVEVTADLNEMFRKAVDVYEWRPVTDDAPEAGNLVELLVRGYRDEFGTWWYPDGDSPLNGWRPLPPPPQDS